MSKTILCVVEGRKTERKILTGLSKAFLESRNVHLMSFDANIYQLYDVLSKQDFLDTFTVLLEHSTKHSEIENKTPNDFTDIFLFFDLDRHSTQAKKKQQLNIDCIEDMLALFNDSTENGQMYISYPMVEAYKHPSHIQPVVPINVVSGYKKLVSNICDKKLDDIDKLHKTDWAVLLLNHLKEHNDFINQQKIIPDGYVADHFTQSIIYQNQLEKHIKSNEEVRVISPFTVFLLDYLGNKLLQEWISEVHKSGN